MLKTQKDLEIYFTKHHACFMRFSMFKRRFMNKRKSLQIVESLERRIGEKIKSQYEKQFARRQER